MLKNLHRIVEINQLLNQVILRVDAKVPLWSKWPVFEPLTPGP